MDWDDLQPPPKPLKPVIVGEPLTAMSMAELESRIESLRAEIARTEAEIAAKRKHEAAAAALFKR